MGHCQHLVSISQNHGSCTCVGFSVAEVPVMSVKLSVCMLLQLICMPCNADCLQMQLLSLNGDFYPVCHAFS